MKYLDSKINYMTIVLVLALILLVAYGIYIVATGSTNYVNIGYKDILIVLGGVIGIILFFTHHKAIAILGAIAVLIAHDLPGLFIIEFFAFVIGEIWYLCTKDKTKESLLANVGCIHVFLIVPVAAFIFMIGYDTELMNFFLYGSWNYVPKVSNEYSNGVEQNQRGNDVYVNGYTTKSGKQVGPYMRTAPNNTVTDNYSHSGNVNPYTGQTGHNNSGGNSNGGGHSGGGRR